MTPGTRALFLAGALAGAVLPLSRALSQQQIVAGPPTETQFESIVPHWKTEEYLLIGNATRGAGEPMIAVDPTDPKTLVAVAMANIQDLAVSSKDLYVVWADNRAGFQGVRLGRAALTAFQFAH